MRPIRALLLAFLLLPLAACGDDPSDPELTRSADRAADRATLTSTGGEVMAGLTDEHLYFGLSDETRAEVEAEMAREVDEAGEGLGGDIARAVTGAVSKAIGYRVQYRIEDVRDLRWEDGLFVIEFENGRVERPKVDDDAHGMQFDEREAEDFIAAFDKLKARRR